MRVKTMKYPNSPISGTLASRQSGMDETDYQGRNTPTGKAKSHYARFRSDPHYLPKYYIYTIACLWPLTLLAEFFTAHVRSIDHIAFWIVGMLLLIAPSFSLIFVSGLYFMLLAAFMPTGFLNPIALACMAFGILLGIMSAALMHNAAHDNFPQTWQSRLIGEICGLFQLTGFVGWSISHTIHHSAPDNPEKDAHAPGHLSFGSYMTSMGTLMKDNLTNKYFEIFGVNRETKRTWSLLGRFLPVVRYTRVFFIFVLMGPVLFATFYVPFKIANALIYGDFNYRTHRPMSDGSFEVLNLNHNVWLRFLNAISFGSYFHKNHHRSPNIFNPRYARDDGKPFITHRVD